MNRTLAIALAALVCGLGVAAIALTGDDVDFRPVWVIAAPAVGWSFIATGLYAWHARPENRVGELMVILGFAWFNYTLLNADSSLVYTWAAITGGLWGSLFLHLGISFPSGHLDSRGDRALVLAGYVIFPLAFVPTLFFNDDDPRNLLLIEPDEGLTDVMRGIGTAIYVTLFVLVMIRSARHYRRADSFERLQLTPVYTFALLTFALVTFAQVGVGDPAWFAAFVSSGLMPFAFIVGLTRSRLSHLDAELRESMEELRASRARLVQAGDAARRKLERDLHDGAQSRLVALALTLRAARKRAGDDEELAAPARPGAGGAADEPRRAARAGAGNPSGRADRARPRGGGPDARRASAGAGDGRSWRGREGCRRRWRARPTSSSRKGWRTSPSTPTRAMRRWRCGAILTG